MKRKISWLWGRILRVEKGKGTNYHLPYNIKAVGKNIKCERGEKDENFGAEDLDLNIRVGEKFRVVGNFIHLLMVCQMNNT